VKLCDRVHFFLRLRRFVVQNTVSEMQFISPWFSFFLLKPEVAPLFPFQAGLEMGPPVSSPDISQSFFPPTVQTQNHRSSA